MKKYTKAILVGLLVVSIGVNMILYKNLREINRKMKDVNKIIASNVESNIRQSIMYIQELLEEDSLEALQNLGSSADTLTMTFNHWVDLNQTDKKPNERMQKALVSIEMLRNTLSHHLVNQYKVNDHHLMTYDIEMLETFNEQLKRLLLVYHNIEDRLLELNDPANSDGGLMQIASNIEEISRLYRHSRIPNQHLQYIDYQEALLKAEEKIPDLKKFQIKEEKHKVCIREGVHYYEVNYFDGEEEAYLLWIDATDGSIRNFESKRNMGGKAISQREAITIAENFVKKFYQGEMKEEMFYMKETEENDALYSFKFIPINQDIQMISDAYTINVSTNSGEVIKYTNDFTDTRVVKEKIVYTPEEIQEKHREEFGDMEYRGLMIVRSFYTRYQPKLTYGYGIIQDQQPKMIFIDGVTGMPIYETYYLYHSIL